MPGSKRYFVGYPTHLHLKAFWDPGKVLWPTKPATR
jgi:hypothetical protein